MVTGCLSQIIRCAQLKMGQNMQSSGPSTSWISRPNVRKWAWQKVPSPGSLTKAQKPPPKTFILPLPSLCLLGTLVPLIIWDYQNPYLTGFRVKFAKATCERLSFLLRTEAADLKWGYHFWLKAPWFPREHPCLSKLKLLSTNWALTAVMASREIRMIINKCKKS